MDTRHQIFFILVYIPYIRPQMVMQKFKIVMQNDPSFMRKEISQIEKKANIRYRYVKNIEISKI